MRKERGITLIALVVTIIVLIILAAISINLLLSDNGIIKKSRDAKLNYELAANEEDTQLKGLVEQLNNLSDGSTTTANYKNPYIPNGFTHTEGTWNNRIYNKKYNNK